MMRFDTRDPKYFDKQELDTEFERIVNVCHGCRLCDNLCPPFTDLFDRIDEEDDILTAGGSNLHNAVDHLTASDYKQVTDTCYQCKLCYPKCPYTPPHEYQLDFPRLLLRSQAIDVKENGKSFRHLLRDKLLGDADKTGRIASRMTGIFNWMNRNPMMRSLMHSIVGIHKNKKLPLYYKKRFSDQTGSVTKQIESTPTEKVALFYTCLLNNNRPWIPEQFKEILEANNIAVIVPPQECCGMPELGTGDLSNVYPKVHRNIDKFLPLVRDGYKIIAMSPSCSMMLRLEYEHYTDNKEAARSLASATLDPCEYLMQLHRKGLLKKGFTTSQHLKVSYHIPCHLKVQNIGFQTRDLLKLIPGVEVTTMQQCSGHDGSFSMKTEFYDISLEAGKKLFKAIEKEKPATVASDCSLAHLHIEEGTGEVAIHPVEIVYQAMGFTKFLQKASV
jgi:Fe-S oxidoreductase